MSEENNQQLLEQNIEARLWVQRVCPYCKESVAEFDFKRAETESQTYYYCLQCKKTWSLTRKVEGGSLMFKAKELYHYNPSKEQIKLVRERIKFLDKAKKLREISENEREYEQAR